MSDVYAEVWQCYAHLPVVMMRPTAVMELVTPGDTGPWSSELAYLWTDHQQHETLTLLNAVLAEGITEPIIIGNDGRLWDGHHRLAVALALGIPVPTRAIPAGGQILEHTAPPSNELGD